MALDGELVALTGLQVLFGTHRHIPDGPLDGLVQLGAAVDAGDGHLVLQGQIALVDDLEGGQGVGAARLPQGRFPSSAKAVPSFVAHARVSIALPVSS